MIGKFYAILKPVQVLVFPIRIKNVPLYKNISIYPTRFLTSASESNGNHEVTYTKVKEIGDKRQTNEFIIDVREPKELQETGVIPGSVNVPLDQLEVALKELSNDQFQKKYGVPKPKQDSLIVFSCKSGIRSSQARALAEQLGYKKTKNYTGGWLDWEEQLKK